MMMSGSCSSTGLLLLAVEVGFAEIGFDTTSHDASSSVAAGATGDVEDFVAALSKLTNIRAAVRLSFSALSSAESSSQSSAIVADSIFP